ncbi:MAG TPA: HupE/UreJ family protein [Rhizobiaceae bacterium]|nr:HupE/UreJ family protein [Rhizobiaceae bacterium]
MNGRATTGIAAAAILVATAPARAHAPLEGVGEFYTGLLHPIIVPAELLATVAVGLLLGFCGPKHCRLGIPFLAAGLILGLAAGVLWTAHGISTGLLLGVALAAAALVTSGLRVRAGAVAVLALIGGVAVGLDAQPDAETFASALLAGAATVLSVTLLTLILAALVLNRKKFWQEVAVRVAGSWITASGVLYFTWRLVGTSQ